MKKGGGRAGGRSEERKRPAAHRGGVLRRIYSRCSPFCSRNHHLCALRCSAFVQRQMCARLLHLAASRIEPVCAVFFNFSLSREYTGARAEKHRDRHEPTIESVFTAACIIYHINRPGKFYSRNSTRRNYLREIFTGAVTLGCAALRSYLSVVQYCKTYSRQRKV